MLRGNSTTTSFSIASSKPSANDVELLAPAIQDNGVMSILNVSNNDLGAEGAKVLALAMYALFKYKIKH